MVAESKQLVETLTEAGERTTASFEGLSALAELDSEPILAVINEAADCYQRVSALNAGAAELCEGVAQAGEPAQASPLLKQLREAAAEAQAAATQIDQLAGQAQNLADEETTKAALERRAEAIAQAEEGRERNPADQRGSQKTEETPLKDR